VIKTMSARKRPPIIALVLTPLFSIAALAQTPQFLGSHRDWNVYSFTEDGQKICYMASEPKRQEGNYTRRGDPAVLVTRRPMPKVVDEVSVQPGYSYLDGSEVEVTIGSRKFALFTRGEHAWTKSEDADQALIAAMKGGNDMTVRGTSTKETYSLDTYSLLGFTAAYEAMVDACRG
jgi:Invasion associated locus B (IalB) protein